MATDRENFRKGPWLNWWVNLMETDGEPQKSDSDSERSVSINSADIIRQAILNMDRWDEPDNDRFFPKSLVIGIDSIDHSLSFSRNWGLGFLPNLRLDGEGRLESIGYLPYSLLRHHSLVSSHVEENLPVRGALHYGNWNNFGEPQGKSDLHLVLPVYSIYYRPSILCYLYDDEQNMFYIDKPVECDQMKHGAGFELADLGNRFGPKKLVAPSQFSLQAFVAGVLAPYKLPESIVLPCGNVYDNFSPIPIKVV